MLDKKYYSNGQKVYELTEDTLTYFYKMILGISNIRGGISVLKQLNYPETIIQAAKNILNTI